MDKYELFDKYLIGDLSDSETDALIDLLKDDEIGRELVEYSLETKLFVDCGKKVKSRISVPSKTGKFRKSKKRRSYLPVLLIAAMMAFAFLGMQLFNEKNYAEISKSSSVQILREGGKLSNNKSLKEGDNVRALAESEIKFNDGSSIQMSSGAEIDIRELVLNKTIFLHRGKVSIHTMPQEIGTLSVITADSRTEVLGTKFSVRKLKVGTVLEVEKGQVRFSNKNDSIEVGQGSLVYTDPKKGFLRKNSSTDNVHWRLWNSLNKNDESLHFYTDFINGNFKGHLLSGKIEMDSKNRHYLSQGLISFPDSAKFQVGKEITMFGWVRILESGVHDPVFTKGDDSWRFQIHQKQPHVGYGGVPSRSHLDSDVTLDLGKWHLIHQVIYQDRVKVFVNGQEVTNVEVSNVSLNKAGIVMIGGNSNKKALVFKGDIGEVGLFNRALSTEEVRDMFDFGKFKE